MDRMPAVPVVECVDPLQQPGWDASVRSFPEATFFHSAVWARVLVDTYGFKPTYLVVREDGELTGILPCMEVPGFRSDRRGVGLPFTDEVAPLARTAVQADLLLARLQQEGRQRGWTSWECRGGRSRLPDAPASVAYWGHSLDLGVGEAQLFGDFAPSVRRALRKADRQELEVRAEDSAVAMDAYYALHCRTRQKHGIPPQPRRFFQNILRNVISLNHGRLFLVRHRGRPVAGAIFFHWRGQALYKFGASDESSLELRPNNLLMWHAIESYCDWGFEQLDFGRTSLANPGLRRFKLGWGASERLIEYLKYDLRRDGYRQEPDQAQGLHNHIFRWLPLPISRWVGEFLYPRMA